jgi:PAS domain S-box-containing protein
MMGLSGWFRNRSLAFKFTLLSIIPVAVVAVSIAFFLIRSIERNMAEAMIERVRDNARLAALSLSNPYVLYNKSLLDRIVDNLGMDRDIRYVMVVDYNDQRILSHNDHSRDGQRVDADGQLRPGQVFTLDKENYVAVEPVRVDGDLFGSVRIGFNLTRINRELQVIKRRMAFIAGVAVLISLFIALMLARMFGKPIRALARQAEKIAEGDLASDICYESGDALGKLATSFRTMTLELRERLGQLSEKEQKYRVLFEGANVAVLIIGQDRIVDCNKMALDLFDSTSEYLMGKSLATLAPEKQADGTLSSELMKQHMLWVTRGNTRHFECTLCRKGRESFDAEISLSPARVGDSDMAQMVVLDITERKRAEAEIENWSRTLEQRVAERTKDLEDAQDAMLNLVEDLNESKLDLERSSHEIEAQKAYLEHLFKASPEGIALISTHGTVIRVNSQFTQLFGYTDEECRGRRLDELILPEELRDDDHLILQSIQDREGLFHETRRKRKDNSLVDVSMTGVPIEIHSENKDMFIIYRDISERKKAEQELHEAREAAETASRAKGDFLANMSHEIRTPMNAIVGLTYLTMQTTLTDRQHDYLTKIDSSAQSLLGVINDILDFSKIEAGRMTMESVDFYLDDVLEKVGDMTTMRADEKGLELVFEPGDSVPQELVGDPLRLGQILVNLVTNAVKFTEKGEIVVRTTLVKDEKDRVTIEFQVRDTGIGMDDEQMARLFKAFSQADTSTTRKYGGTGLGLVICKRLVQMMDGEIWIESESGKGSAFFFTAGFGRHARQRDNARLFAQDFKGMHALIVDDSSTARQSLKRILESFQLNVETAASGREALAMIKTIENRGAAYDLILTDWKMPLMDGLETARVIKKRKDSSKIPVIIMVTAYGREDVLEQADRIGLDGFITKPVSPSTLLDSIMQAFGTQALSQGKKVLEPARHDKGLDLIAGARILLAEDNEVNQQVATELLQSVGLEVVCAFNGQDVLDRMAEDQFDAILMDIQMPVMDGFETTHLLRGREREEKREPIPIIALTAHAMAGDREKSLQYGMNDHLTKPLDPEILFTTLVRWIEPRENAALKPATRIDKQSDEKQLDLPGIDYEKALARVGGKQETYVRLTRMFIRNQEGIAELIAEALSAGDVEKARELAHSLKGVSGNLGATALFRAAMDLELSIRKNRSDAWNEKISITRKCLDDVLNVFRSINPKTPAPKTGRIKRHVSSAESVDIIETLETMKKLVLEKNYSAGKYMGELYKLNVGEDSKKDLERLAESIRSFDFTEALKITQFLLEHYKQDDCEG